jgi:hypothetical protein
MKNHRFLFILLSPLLLTPALIQAKDQAKAPPAWKSEADYRKAAPEVHRKSLWLEENADAEAWPDSLKTVLTWARGVPYATLGTTKVFEKEVKNLPGDAVAGRVSSMLTVGYAQLATEPDFEKASEFEMAKAGLLCMIRYYENVKQGKPDYSIAAMERYSGLFHSGALDEYIQAKLRK